MVVCWNARVFLNMFLASLILLVGFVVAEIETEDESVNRQLRLGKLKARKRPLVLGLSSDPHEVAEPPSGPQPRIIGGRAVDPEEDRYPYFALMWGKGICGGALITPSIVVSAAHCEIAANAVTVGIQSRESEWIGKYDSIPVVKKVTHPDHGNNSYDHDIMLMKLETPSDKPNIRLNSDPSVPGGSQDIMWTLGFGDTDASSEQDIPKELHVVDVKHVSQSTCDASFRNIRVSDDMLCAAANGKDACGGDSGGPMIEKGDSVDADILMGVVSWGIGCADTRYPGVYSRISYFYDWIIEQVCELSPDDAPEYMGCKKPSPSPSVSMAPSVSAFPSTAPSISAFPSTAPSISAFPSIVPSMSSFPSSEPSIEMDSVRFISWNVRSDQPLLGHCEGDCDSDKDCIGDLVCFNRYFGGEVPGCLTNGGTKVEELISDICVNP